jgi:hypothetical protein
MELAVADACVIVGGGVAVLLAAGGVVTVFVVTHDWSPELYNPQI